MNRRPQGFKIEKCIQGGLIGAHTILRATSKETFLLNLKKKSITSRAIISTMRQ